MKHIWPVAKVEKIHTAREVKSSHVFRRLRSASRQPPWTDPEMYIRQASNRAQGPDDLLRSLLVLFMKRKIKPRKNSVFLAEMVLSASALFFLDPLTPGEKNEINSDRADAFVKASLRFVDCMFKGRVGALEVHYDEQTPHIHVLVVPITPDNRLSARDVFTPKTLDQLHTDFAEYLKPLGISRAVRGRERIATSPRDFRKACDLPGFELPMLPLALEAENIAEQNENVDRWNARYAVERVTSIYRARESKVYERVLDGTTRADARRDHYGEDPVFGGFPFKVWSELCFRTARIRSTRQAYDEESPLLSGALEKIFFRIKVIVEKRTQRPVQGFFSANDTQKAVEAVLCGLFGDFDDEPVVTFNRILDRVRAKFDRLYGPSELRRNNTYEPEEEWAQALHAQWPIVTEEGSPFVQSCSTHDQDKDAMQMSIGPDRRRSWPAYQANSERENRQSPSDGGFLPVSKCTEEMSPDVEADEGIRNEAQEEKVPRRDDDDFGPVLDLKKSVYGAIRNEAE